MKHDLPEYVRFKDMNAELTNFSRRDETFRFDGAKMILPAALSNEAKLVAIGMLVMAIKRLIL